VETTSIALDREAYDLLRQKKRPGESFSQAVKRLAGRTQPLSSFAGAWKDLPGRKLREIEAERRRMREQDEARFEKLMKGATE
jgi:predicted CopG family antitoxin